MSPSPKRLAIVQSNYIPWRGYFDLIASVDEFVLLDDAQYTRRDWRNRNKIKTPSGAKWLTIAVDVKGRYEQAIQDTRVADESWAADHWTTLRHLYSGARGFEEAAPILQRLYETVPGPFLSDINRHFLTGICGYLGIDTKITWSRDYAPEGTRTDRLIDICVKAEASEYVSGPSAMDYLDETGFAARDIAVSWHSYGPYPEYEQPYPPFDGQVSIVDTIFCAGSAAGELLVPLPGATS